MLSQSVRVSTRSRLAKVLVPLMPLIGVVAAGCSQAQFSGEAGKRAAHPAEVIEKTISLSCDSDAPVQKIELDARDTLKLTLRGEFCPAASNDLTVLFVLDASASMGKHYESTSSALNSGNDPRQGDSCGRLAAVSAVVAKLKTDSATVNTNVGLITFAGGVVSTVSLQTTEDFIAAMTVDMACNFVSQGERVGYHPQNPGAIRAKVSASTNYASALDAATDMVGGVDGRKVIYFVSDGMPTSGGANPAAAGVAAGQRLRGLTDTTVNGLLLGQSGAAAKSVMTAVVGGASRVRLAGNASELAAEITKFPAASVDGDSLSATFNLNGEESVLGVSATAAATPTAFGYTTDAIELPGSPDVAGTTDVSLSIAAKSADGQPLSASQQVIISRL